MLIFFFQLACGFLLIQCDAPGTAGRSKSFQNVSFQKVASCGFDQRLDFIDSLKKPLKQQFDIELDDSK